MKKVLLVTLAIMAVILLTRETENKTSSNALVRQHSYLLKTKLATVEYLRLDPKNTGYEYKKSQIEARIKDLKEKGPVQLEEVENKDLVKKTKHIYDKHEYSVSYLQKLTDLLKEYSLAILQTQ